MDVVRSIAVDDEIVDVKILRTRDHEYIPDTIPLDATGEVQDATVDDDDENAGNDAGGGDRAGGDGNGG